MWEQPQGGPPAWFSRELTLGDEGDDVRIVQRKTAALITGTYDDDTAARVRGVEKKMGRKKQTGRVDAEVAKTLGEKPGAGQLPEWFNHDVKAGDSCGCVAQLRLLLKQPNLPAYFDADLENAVRRYESEIGLKPSGIASKPVVQSLADRSF